MLFDLRYDILVRQHSKERYESAMLHNELFHWLSGFYNLYMLYIAKFQLQMTACMQLFFYIASR